MTSTDGATEQLAWAIAHVESPLALVMLEIAVAFGVLTWPRATHQALAGACEQAKERLWDRARAADTSLTKPLPQGSIP